MEKGRKIRKFGGIQLFGLIAFGIMALASTSSKSAADFMDGFVDGYNSTRGDRGEINEEKDSLQLSDNYDMAFTSINDD